MNANKIKTFGELNLGTVINFNRCTTADDTNFVILRHFEDKFGKFTEVLRIDQEKAYQSLTEKERNLSLASQKLESQIHLLEERKSFLNQTIEENKQEQEIHKVVLYIPNEHRNIQKGWNQNPCSFFFLIGCCRALI